jgi:2-oxoglutarate ferredoxin oxidoreductase subunit alpha
MADNNVRIAFLGSGGDGVMSVASIVMQSAAKLGIYGMMAQSYGPQIRGGESAAYLQLSDSAVYSENFTKDLVICFNSKKVDRFKTEFAVGKKCLLIYEEDAKNELPEWLSAKAKFVMKVPFKKLLEEANLPKVSKNIYVFGMLVKMFDWNFKKSTNLVEQAFLKKGPVITNNNISAFQAGYRYSDSIKLPVKFPLKGSDVKLRTAVGNDVCAEAALKAGCRFFAGYPITPSTEILHKVIKIFPGKGGKVVQAEDEIASLGMVIGASYGGVPSMTATSGPGLSLMTEMIGLSSIAAIPAVIINVQRGGPSTGIPSKTEQSDLFHSVHGGHGDFPRAVLAATDVEDCWDVVFKAFYISEKYRVPVIVHSDGYIGQRSENIAKKLKSPLKEKPRRIKMKVMPQHDSESFKDLYPDLPDGVAPILSPGKEVQESYLHVAGIERDEMGRASASKEVHDKNSLIRLRKMKSIKEDTKEGFEVHGDENAKLGFVAWGSTKGAVLDFIRENPKAKLFVPKMIHPFPKDGLKAFKKSVDKMCFVELNYQGQLFQYVKTFMDLPKDTLSLKCGGGRPLSPMELTELLKESTFSEVITCA